VVYLIEVSQTKQKNDCRRHKREKKNEEAVKQTVGGRYKVKRQLERCSGRRNTNKCGIEE
jgi:hypothetical protein